MNDDDKICTNIIRLKAVLENTLLLQSLWWRCFRDRFLIS